VHGATLDPVLAVLSPAKRLEFDAECPFVPTVAPLLKETKKLSEVTRKLSLSDLRQLMKLSVPLSQLNVERFASFKATARPVGAKPAVWAFDGDTYTGLRARSFSEAQMRYAQDHLRILSGLYGLLRPLDAILPYRLEMGTRLGTSRGSTLYDFWGDLIARQLNSSLKSAGTQVLLNLASQEYFQAVDCSALRAQVVTPHFKERRGRTLKVISFSAKRARGAMARYLIEQRATEPAQLMGFRGDGYRFDKSLSDETNLVFVREQP